MRQGEILGLEALVDTGQNDYARSLDRISSIHPSRMPRRRLPVSQIVRIRDLRSYPHAVEVWMQVGTNAVLGIHWLGDGDQHLGEVGIGLPVMPHVGIGELRIRDRPRFFVYSPG